MPAPSFSVTIGDRGAAAPQPGDVGAWFVAGLFDRGPAGAVNRDGYLSLSAVKAAYGDVVTYSYTIRAIETYFREANGSGRVYISRFTGAAATKGILALSSAAPAVVGTVTAISPGSWSTELTVTVTAGTGSGRIVTLKQAGATVFSAEFTTALDLQAAIVATGLATFPLGAGTWPIAVSAEAALSAGSDDRASIPTTEAGWLAALDAFDVELGTGTVSLPGITTPAAHAALIAHAESRRRFAELDAIDTPTTVSLTAPAATLRALNARAGYGQLLAPWVTIPGPGITTVVVPPSGAVAGRMAAADRENRAGPGQPAAASYGVFRFVRDVTQEYTAAQRDILADAGVTVIRNIRGKVQPYSSRTLANPDTLPQYDSAAGVRVVLAIASECNAAIGKYIETLIDGHGHIYSAVEKDLRGIAKGWFDRDALFGETASDAFDADVGPGAASRSIAANLIVRPGESVNTIDLLITNVASGDQI